MLNALVLALFTQLPMQGICTEDKPAVKQPPAVVVQEKVVVVKIYVMLDKFDVEHHNENLNILINEVREANKKPFKLQDRFGQWWEHQDKATLQRFVSQLNYDVRPQAPVYGNCATGQCGR
jgi:hypothetical protein